MKDTKLGVIESRFADLIWENEPITTTQLIKLCEQEFDWKRTTTYTVLKRLSNRGIFSNNDGVVTSLISHDEFYAYQSKNYVKDSFGGSLPAFLSAFTSGVKLTQSEVDEIQKMIDSYKEK